MMADLHVLLIGSKDGLSTELTSLLEQDSNDALVVETADALQGALTRISRQRYDAVVCWAERQAELASVRRIRRASPQVPILVLTSQKGTSFHEMALQLGATKVARNDRDLIVVAEDVRIAVHSGKHVHDVEARESGIPPREGVGQSWSGSHKNLNVPDPSFIPLLVEDDPNQALLMARAFREAQVFNPLPVLQTGEEAIAYLSAAAPFEDRDRFPLPSLLILDCNLPMKSGLEVLEWIRARSVLNRLPVVMLSSSSDPDQIERAYQQGANSYLVKPTSFASLLELVSDLKQYWGSTNQT